ncbi:MAG: SDR family NAD(P)-dependent oxidoreductase [Bacteroidota bacterium]
MMQVKVRGRKARVAVVTGAGGTLCSEMARSLAGQGIHVALLGQTVSKLQAVEEEIISNGGKAISFSVDVTDEKTLIDAEGEISAKLGAANILINGAGGNQMNAITTVDSFVEEELNDSDPAMRGFFNLEMDAFARVLEVNTMGSVIPSQVFGRSMARQRAGVIINIASMNSYRPLSRVGAYGMAKAGILNFTQWLADYLAPANVRVNAIAPGFFLNERSKKRLMTEGGGYSERGQRIIDHTPMARFGKANELIGCMNWMIDESSSGFLTGVTVPIDGGFLSNSGV